MKLVDARWVINQVEGKDYNYMRLWGISTIREAIRTIYNRRSSTADDRSRVDIILNNILRKE